MQVCLENGRRSSRTRKSFWNPTLRLEDTENGRGSSGTRKSFYTLQVLTWT
ncbi:hypothetical protein Hanom_Chr04g00282291 [Helianthus anomalus]